MSVDMDLLNLPVMGGVTPVNLATEPKETQSTTPSNRRRHTPSRPNHSGNLNLNLHRLLHQLRLHHGSRGPRLPEEPAQQGPDGGKVGAVREDVADADDVGGGGAGVGEGGGDCGDDVGCLGGYVWGEGVGFVVVAGGC